MKRTVILIGLVASLTSCASLGPYQYAYMSPLTQRMTELREGNPQECLNFFPPGAYVTTGSHIPPPPAAAVFGHFIVVHGNEVRASAIYKWRSEDGRLWYVFEPTGPAPQLKANSAQEFVLEIERRFRK